MSTDIRQVLSDLHGRIESEAERLLGKERVEAAKKEVDAAVNVGLGAIFSRVQSLVEAAEAKIAEELKAPSEMRKDADQESSDSADEEPVLVSSRDDAPDNVVTVRIEIPKGSNVKYEIDHETGELIVDRVLYSPAQYFFNYGYVEKSLGGDGDPLDAVVLCDDSLYPTSLIRCKVVGMLVTSDEKGRDEKIILVPDDKIDHSSEDVNDIHEVSRKTRVKIHDFFETYKRREKGKKSVVADECESREKAMEVVRQAFIDYEKNHSKTTIQDVLQEH